MRTGILPYNFLRRYTVMIPVVKIATGIRIAIKINRKPFCPSEEICSDAPVYKFRVYRYAASRVIEIRDAIQNQFLIAR